MQEGVHASQMLQPGSLELDSGKEYSPALAAAHARWSWWRNRHTSANEKPGSRRIVRNIMCMENRRLQQSSLSCCHVPSRAFACSARRGLLE